MEASREDRSPLLLNRPADSRVNINSEGEKVEKEKKEDGGEGGGGDGGGGEEEEEEDSMDESTRRRRHMGLLPLFLLFLKIGFQLWGGPMAQIALLRSLFVDGRKWITIPQFNRVCAVYQVLPGPEATELAIYFGVVSRGRLGGLLAGLGFLLPGFSLMLLVSYLYVEFGITLQPVKDAFMAIQPAVAAMILSGVYKLSLSSFQDADTKEFNIVLFLMATVSAFLFIINIPFFVTLPYVGLLYFLFKKIVTTNKECDDNGNSKLSFSSLTVPLWWCIFFTLWVGGFIGGFAIYYHFLGWPSPVSMGGGTLLSGHSLPLLFLLGFVAGFLSFGGAFATVPFIQQEAVVLGKWLLQQQFVDSIAIVQMIPTPMVMFSTLIGYIGGGWGGAFLMTLGIFLPAFSFPILGHRLFQRIVSFKPTRFFLDGVTAAVMGLVGPAAAQLMRNLVTNPLEGVIFVVALGVVFTIKSPWTSPMLVLCSALAGQILFAPQG